MKFLMLQNSLCLLQTHHCNTYKREILQEVMMFYEVGFPYGARKHANPLLDYRCCARKRVMLSEVMIMWDTWCKFTSLRGCGIRRGTHVPTQTSNQFSKGFYKRRRPHLHLNPIQNPFVDSCFQRSSLQFHWFVASYSRLLFQRGSFFFLT